MAFGKTFYTRKEAKDYTTKKYSKYEIEVTSLSIRKLSKRVFPRHKKRYHVGTEIDFLNFQ